MYYLKIFLSVSFNISGQWEIVPGSGPGMTLGPDEAEWRWNSLTQNWERTVVTGNSGASGGKAQKKYVWFRLLTNPKFLPPTLNFFLQILKLEEKSEQNHFVLLFSSNF